MVSSPCAGQSRSCPSAPAPEPQKVSSDWMGLVHKCCELLGAPEEAVVSLSASLISAAGSVEQVAVVLEEMASTSLVAHGMPSSHAALGLAYIFRCQKADIEEVMRFAKHRGNMKLVCGNDMRILESSLRTTPRHPSIFALA